MLRRFVPCLGTLAIASAALLILAEPVAAQGRGWRGGSYYGGSRGYWGGYDGYRGYGYRSYSPYYYGGFGGGLLGTGIAVGDGYGLYYSPYQKFPYTPAAFDESVPANVSAFQTSTEERQRASFYSLADDNTVNVSVRVSPGAELWIDGVKTVQTGGLRQFVSPPIARDREYTYAIRATWMDGERAVDQTRKVSFHAGDRVTVNFTKPAEQITDVKEKLVAPKPLTPLNVLPDQPKARERELDRLPARLAPVNEKPDPSKPLALEREAARPAALAEKNSDEGTHDGQVVRIEDGKLVMKLKDDKEHGHTLAAKAIITCDTASCKLEDLKPGMRVRVTTKNDNKVAATRIEALDQNIAFEKRDK